MFSNATQAQRQLFPSTLRIGTILGFCAQLQAHRICPDQRHGVANAWPPPVGLEIRMTMQCGRGSDPTSPGLGPGRRDLETAAHGELVH